MLLAASFIVIAVTSVIGAVSWGGMQGEVLLLPPSAHDFIYLVLLFFAYEPGRNKQTYCAVVTGFVAVMFLGQSALQLIDLRGVGDEGRFALLSDHVVNALISATYLLTVVFLIKNSYIERHGRLPLFYSIVVVFLGLNALLAVPTIRGGAVNYAAVYDTIYYACFYLLCVSSSDRTIEFIRSSYHSVVHLLHYRGGVIRKG